MTERDRARTGTLSTAFTRDEELTPGRISRSALLDAPTHPVISGLIARKHDGNGVAEGADAAIATASSSGGMALPQALADKFGSSLGADLSSVRVHTGTESHAAARAVGAKAYTLGQDIHFAAGQYDPSSSTGEHLLAHEVAHTVQQRGGTPTRQNKLEVSAPQDAAEHEADHAANAMVRGAAATISGFSGMIMRDVAKAPPTTGMGVSQLQLLIQRGRPQPEDVKKLIEAHPDERDAMIKIAQDAYGHGYVEQVIADGPDTTTGAKPIGSKGSSFAANALAKPEKDPADKLTANMSLPEAYAERADHHVHPGFLYTDGKDDVQRQQLPNYIGHHVGPEALPGPAQAQPDASISSGGTRWAHTSTETGGAGSMKTVVDGSKAVVMPGFDTSPAAQRAAVDQYRTAVTAELDKQIAALEPHHFVPLVPNDAKRAAKQDQHELELLKEKVLTASSKELDDLVGRRGLAVMKPEDVRASNVTTTKDGTHVGGVFDGTAISAHNHQNATVTSAPGGVTTMTTTGSTDELSTKGANASHSRGTTITDQENGTVDASSTKRKLTGGFSDDLKTEASWTNAHADAATNRSRITNVAAGLQSGNGFGGATASASIAKGDPAKVNPTSQGESLGAETDSSLRPNASVSGQAGVVQNENGTGVQAAVPDARVDALGHSKIAAGGYLATDGSLQVLVTPNPDGSVTLKFTATVHAKAGLFAGKRDAAEPVESGGDASIGGGGFVAHNRIVVRTRKVSKEKAPELLRELDHLASGEANGKKTFGTAAAADAYAKVFNHKLADLALGDPTPGPDETVSVQSETGYGGEGKVGMSNGDSANSRASIGLTVNGESLELLGRDEAPTETGTTVRRMFGHRTSGGGTLSAGFSGAGGSASLSKMAQDTRTYVFPIPKDKTALLTLARAVNSEQAAKDFKKQHKEVNVTVIYGEIGQEGSGGGINAGPGGLAGATTATLETNAAFGTKMVMGPDGKEHEVKTLSGTADGTRDEKASASLFNVKLAQSQTTTAAHANVDDDGKGSLDVTTTKSSGNVFDAPKNVRENGKADFLAAAVTGGGPIGLAKKLAERVGEQSTVGRHFDDAAFRIIVGTATKDPAQWARAAGNQFRDEWSTLRSELASPKPLSEWIANDDSYQHIAAFTLAQMKSIAKFTSETGEAGRTMISRLSGEYSANAIGQTVSWPPSLQDQKTVFDALAKSVEHLKANLAPYAEAGDAIGGNAFLDKLNADLGTLRTKIQNAPDHENATLGLRAANGIGDMQVKVATFKERFANAIAAFSAKKPAGEIDAELDAKESKSSTMIKDSNAASDRAWRAREATAKLERPPSGSSAAAQAAYNKQHEAAIQAENQAKQDAETTRKKENDQRAAEAADTAKKQIPNFEQRCLADKNQAWSTLAQAGGAVHDSDIVREKLLSLGNTLKQWAQDWDALHGYYKDAGMPDGYRVDLKPALMGRDFSVIVDSVHVSDNWRGYARELRTQWGTL